MLYSYRGGSRISEGGSKYRDGSLKQGSGGTAIYIGRFILKTLKSLVMQDY